MFDIVIYILIVLEDQDASVYTGISRMEAFKSYCEKKNYSDFLIRHLGHQEYYSMYEESGLYWEKLAEGIAESMHEKLAAVKASTLRLQFMTDS